MVIWSAAIGGMLFEGGVVLPSRLEAGCSGAGVGTEVVVLEPNADEGARRGLGLSVVELTRLPMEEMRLFTFASVRPTTVRDFMARGIASVARLR